MPRRLAFAAALAAVVVALAMGRYLLGAAGNETAIGVLAPDYAREQLGVLADFPVWELVHRVGGSALVVLGLLQYARLRSHRWTGRAFVALALAAAGGGAWMALESPWTAGEVAPALLFAALLVGFVAAGIVRARRRAWAAHGRWMSRALAVALGVGTVRLVYVVLWAALGVDQHEAMAAAFWIGWPLPLAVYEIAARA
jgi:hypothetical protein